MQKEFLEGLGIVDATVIDKIMAENSADIKKIEAERDNYKTQLETAQNTLKEFDGVNIHEMQEKIKTLTNDLETKQNEYNSKIADMEFNSVLDSALSKFGARNSKAVKALLDIDNLKLSKNQIVDIEKALENVKADNDYLFVNEEPFKNAVRSNPIHQGKKMTLLEAMKYANSHPETDIKRLI